MKVEITFPFYYSCEDYHEFRPFVDSLSQLTGKSIGYNELDHLSIDEDDVPEGIILVGNGFYTAEIFVMP